MSTKKERITFLGTLYPNETINELLKDTKGNLQFAGDTFQKNVVRGLKVHYDLRIFTCLDVGSYPKRFNILNMKKYMSFNKENCEIIPYKNLTIYKEFSLLMHLRKKLKTVDFSDNEKIIIYSMKYSLISVAVGLKKKYPNLNIHLIITDFPEFFSSNKLAILYGKLIERLSNKLIRKIDSFTVMTNYMREKLPKNAKSIVIEGIYKDCVLNNVNKYFYLQKKHSSFIVLYTGTLDTRYGILHLIKSYLMLHNKNIELWICGTGDGKTIVEKYSKENDSIKYFGLLNRDKVLEIQKESDLLINPRTSEGEYTKYSFPSKTIEYMVSGKPVLMHRLPGIPEEYYPYLFFAPDNTDKSLCSEIFKIYKMSAEELFDFGKKAAEFVINNKNCFIQSEKIIGVMNEK